MIDRGLPVWMTLSIILLVMLLATMMIGISFKTQDAVREVAYMNGFYLGTHAGWIEGEKRGYQKGIKGYRDRFYNKPITDLNDI
jgi:hypothetical protein